MNTDDKTIRNHTTFRVILSAMSHPGKVFRLPQFDKEETAAVELLSCLFDNEVGVAVIGDHTLAEELNRHTGCRLVPCKEADFVVIGNLASKVDLADVKRGSLEYPNNGATLVYLVDGLSEAEGGVVLEGPGVREPIPLRISGLAAGELSRLREANSQYPLGIDAIFFVPRRNGRVACIPRSSKIGEN
jgi:alpha-D-ribose 1-methylphosphonate 5-triphosphate synthase subunit PhnH